MQSRRFLPVAQLAARVALAAAFLSAVADRFGLWGGPGSPGVAWGDWQAFEGYTGVLLWFLPGSLVSIAAVGATILEVGLAVLLLAKLRVQETSLVSAALLLTFAIAMTAAHGLKPPLDYSVFSAVAAALLLSATSSNRS